MARGHISERPPGSGRWRIQWLVGKSPQTGKYVYHNKTVRGSRRDAQKALTRILADLDAGTHIERTRYTVTQFFRRWLTDYAGCVSAHTLEHYESIVRVHIVPSFLGQMELSSVRTADIQRYYTAKLKTLSSTSVNHHNTVLSCAFRCAVEWEALAYSPVVNAKPPKISTPTTEPYIEAELRKLVLHILGNKYELPILIAMTTGLRLSEVLGLQWGDIDVRRRRLNVERAVEKTKTYGLRLVKTKTDASRRPVRLLRCMIHKLAVARRLQRQTAAMMRSLWRGDGKLICPADDGAIRDPDVVSKAFGRICDKVAVKRKYHRLRHTYGSLLLDRGASLKVVQELLGHAKIGTTGDIYVHPSDESRDRAADAVDNVFGIM